MKNTDKVTLSFEQLKKLINESKSTDWCVIRFGGSIGTKFTHRVNGKPCVIYDDNITEIEAKENVKKYRKFLTPGEKQYYKYAFKAVPRNMVKDK